MNSILLKEYIEMRNKQSFDLNVFWKIYQDSGGKLKNPQDFAKHFLNQVKMVDGMEIIIARDKNQIISGMDSKLGLSILYDKNNNFIKVVN